jgi:TraC protein
LLKLIRNQVKLYDRPPSFTNQLPWLEYDPEHQVVLLADGHSIGVAFELRPVSTEARPDAWLLALRDKIQAALSSAIPEHDDPWILQLYVQDETRLDRLAGEIAQYASIDAKARSFPNLGSVS